LPGGGESQVEAARRYVAAYRRLLARPEATLLVVTHGLPLGLLLNAAEGLAPLPVAGRDVPLATPFRFDRAALAAAVERIEDWLQAYATRDGRGG
jgi:broad specificity phosphatase PhoE